MQRANHFISGVFLLIIAMLFCTFFSSCQKNDDDQSPPPSQIIYEDEPCEEVSPITIFHQHEDTLNISLSVTSPTDPNEIIAYWFYKKKLVKLNTSTGQVVSIADDFQTLSRFQWGSRDWLLFRGVDGLMKIKSNGDSLSLISQNAGFAYAWNPDGSKYMCNELIGGSSYMIVRNRHDEILDTLQGVFNTSIGWASENVVWYTGGYYLIDEDSVVNLGGFGSGFVAAVDDMTAYCNSIDGLIRMDRFAQDIEVIRAPYQSCDYFFDISYSHLKNKLLTTRQKRTLLPDGRSTFNLSEVVWLNLDGSIHEVIDHRSMLENL